MSIKLTGGNGIFSAAIDMNAPYTQMGYFYLTTGEGVLFSGWNSNYTVFDSWVVGGSNYDLRVQSASLTISAPTFIGVNQWFHFAVVRESSTQISVYENGLPITAPASNNVATRSAIINGINCDNLGQTTPAHFAHIFEYQASLTQSEIQNQMNFALPMRTDNLLGWLPAKNASFVDFSGTGREYYIGNANYTVGDIEPPVIYAPPPMLFLKPPPIIVYFKSPRMLLAC